MRKDIIAMWRRTFRCSNHFLASNRFRKVRTQFDDFQQKTVAKALGIAVDESKLHDAEYDIDICMRIFNKVANYVVDFVDIKID